MRAEAGHRAARRPRLLPLVAAIVVTVPGLALRILAGAAPHPVEGGNTAAKNAAMGATVATFTSGTLPITSLVLPAAPPPPSIPTPFPGTNKGSTTTALTPTVSSIPSVCFPPSCIPVQTPR